MNKQNIFHNQDLNINKRKEILDFLNKNNIHECNCSTFDWIDNKEYIIEGDFCFYIKNQCKYNI